MGYKDRYEELKKKVRDFREKHAEGEEQVRSSVKSGLLGIGLRLVIVGLVLADILIIWYLILPAELRTILEERIGTIYSSFIKQLAPTLERFPVVTSILAVIPIVVLGALIYLLASTADTNSLKTFIPSFILVVMIIVNLIIVGVFYAFETYGGTQQIICWATLGFQSPECLGSSEVPEAPPVTKAGCEGQNCYNVFELHYGYENDDPPYKAPIIYSEQECIVDASIKNIAVPERTISGVTVSGKIRDDAQACEREGGCVKLIPKDCTNDAPCEILPTSQSFSVALDCAKPVTFKANTFVDVILETTFPVEAQGSNDFNIYGRAAQIQDSDVVETSPGPLDIIVYFTPPQLFTTSKNTLVNMFVEIDNKQTGSAVVNKIRIERFSDFPLLDKAKCFPQWDKSITWNEDEDYELDAAVTDRILIICELGVQGPLEAIAPDESQGVKFFAFVDYTYTQRHLEPVKIKQVITPT